MRTKEETPSIVAWEKKGSKITAKRTVSALYHLQKSVELPYGVQKRLPS